MSTTKTKERNKKMKMKLYETYDYRTKKKYWWTQRDKNTNCFEIRQMENGKVRLFINETEHEDYDTLIDAERVIKEMWVA